MPTIEKISVAPDRISGEWGVNAYDYNLNGVHRDLQDLLVFISQNRAAAIEDEVRPLQTIINRRNARLEKYGTVLAKLTELQGLYSDKDTGGKTVGIGNTISAEDFEKIMTEIGYGGFVTGSSLEMAKSSCDGAVSRVKSAVDEMNNAAQKDMTRLQSVVDRRDEAYSTATTMMTAVSDTRSSLIKNL